MWSRTAARVLLASGLALGLVGCGGGEDPPTSTDDPLVVGGEEEGTATEESAAEATAEDQTSSAEETSGSGDTQETSMPPDADLREANFAVDVARALQISAEETGAEEVVFTIELEFSRHYDAWVWTIETLAGGTDHDVEIDADTGEVLDHEQDSGDDQERAVDATDPMTPERAMELATAEVDGRVRAWKLEWEDGAMRYEVEVVRSGGDDVDVLVDAASGAVRVTD
ncbi:PepSY domain-containing protein [Ruania albidiflava]|uniref:PepSY domain-containing protein n=1 Tax=Ruania albidiflava TaxID=366586 RepID=UPI0003B44AD3|nr:PepSY domain-containing protein [Ruania albidiflava]